MVTSLVSAPWASSSDIPAGTTTPAGGWDGPLAEASDVLFELSGRQFRGAGQSQVQIRPSGIVELPLLPGYVPTPVPLVPVLAGWFPGQAGLQVVRLPSTPVISVDEVTIGRDVVDPALYECDTAGLLRRTDCRPWPCDGSLLVTFTHGIEPPLGGKRSAVTLAVELAKARAGDGSCRLRNIQTISREGVTMGAVSLRDAITARLTGLYEVDLWLKTVNPHGLKRRGGAWTPDTGRARRVVTQSTSQGLLTDNLVIQQGDDRPVEWTLSDRSGTPANLEGYTVFSQVRSQSPTGTLLHEWSTTAGNAAVDGSTVILKVDDSESWTWTSGIYDVHLTDPSGQTEVMARGYITVMPTTSHPQ